MIVRSTAGFTVVSSVSVLVTPVFLMLPVTVAVLKMVEPAEATTCPVIVYQDRAAGVERPDRAPRPGARSTEQPPMLPIGAVRDDLGDGDAGRLQALRAVAPSTTSSARVEALFGDEDLVGEQAARDHGIGAGARDHRGAVGQVDR